MLITEHAIHRYKQRIGKKTAARKRIVASINHDLKKDVWFRKNPKKEHVNGTYILVTSKYQAVCIKGHVVTIEELTPSLKEQVERLKRQKQESRKKGNAVQRVHGEDVRKFVI
ncbi:hypothetical protein IEO70_03855 [Bacillus sp. AGMB 02131]|uniref:Uncharacterized protein n=1 Tax=Peribacillus faecalis TaxID=2772559 RepID=A0A927CXI0_9BACI|nr:hypothetical protein [Peribacillus faecalis]MBD3107490.1 hypothetical protein [Peribacillus faecalis]